MTVSTFPAARAVSPADLADFVASVQGVSDAYFAAKFPTLTVPVISSSKGRKFARIIRDTGSQRMVYCFVEMTTGDLYKAASWKAPAKNFARGNIFTAESVAKLNSYSVG